MKKPPEEGNSQVLEDRSEFSILCVVTAKPLDYLPYASIRGPSCVRKCQVITTG